VVASENGENTLLITESISYQDAVTQYSEVFSEVVTPLLCLSDKMKKTLTP